MDLGAEIKGSMIGLALAGGLIGSLLLDREATRTTRDWIHHNGSSVVESVEDSLDYEIAENLSVETGEISPGGKYRYRDSTIVVNPAACRRPNIGFIDFPRISYPSCEDVIEHEVGHHIPTTIAGYETVYGDRSHIPIGWHYVTEGIAQWVDGSSGGTATPFECDLENNMYDSDSNIYGCGHDFVKPLLDEDLEKGVSYLYDNLPEITDIQDPQSYHSKAINTIQ
jgi:hypothetical protein